ncbi:hypothetical protein ACH4GP_17445 [Streptomyces celluloflavus]|uniref:NACHT domain-containing protein n=1 Tax=Streptomyces celluloflavus TaxID=58344 RepID=A0ABW7RDN1_9ACTN
MAQKLGIAASTFRDWRDGKTVPPPSRVNDFRSVVRKLQQAADRPVYTDAEWLAALRAAQEEGRGRPPASRRWDPSRRFVRIHGPALDAAAVDAQGRTGEHTDLNAFVRDLAAGAPSYLCWHADAPVGKTALLADYIRRRPPADTDILSFFISSAHGTDTRAAFEEEMADQIGEFLGRPGNHLPLGVREWKRLFADAATESTRHGRRLLLVVDGLDDDAAWSGLVAEGKTPTSERQAPTGTGVDAKSRPRTGTKDPAGQSPVRGSIAALLPAPPPPGMRVIVSLRRCLRWPDDVSERHPLRQGKHLRTLLPVAGVPLLRQPSPGATALGGPVAGLLAVAGGGLRTADLAELTGLPEDRLDRLAAGPAGRSLVLDEPMRQTYALAEPRLADAVREDLGEAGVLRHTRELLAWSQEWRMAGWPDETPPYPLEHQLRLLTGSAERTAYVLDMPRLRRLARTAGPAVALAQLDAFEEEVSAAAGATADGLTTLVPLSAARALLRRQTREVPDGAPALLVRLGDVGRARGLALSAPTPSARAVHLADVAVEMAYAELTGVDVVVREAAEWLTHIRTNQGFPGMYRAPEPGMRLLESARTLVTLNGPGAARPLVRAVVHDRAAGTDVLIQAAGLMGLVQELDVVGVLYDRAETLSAGGTRARAAAVDLWGALACAVPFLGPHAGDRIEAICEELGPSDGLRAVEVLAAAASALAQLPAKRSAVAAKQVRTALARMAEAVAALEDREALPEEDRAHLGRELAGTLARLAQAVDDTGVTRNALDDIRRLMYALPEYLRIGVLGDSMLERAQWVVKAAEKGRERADREARATAERDKNAKRRDRDRSNAKYKRDMENRKKSGDRDKSPASLKAWRMPHGEAQVAPAETGDPQREVRGAPATARRSDTHRKSAGLPSPGDGPQPHLLSLHEADSQLGAGNLLHSRELLEEALRQSPASEASPPGHRPPVLADWAPDLCQALGMAGEFDQAEALAVDLLDVQDRARRLAALSLGCSLGGFSDAGTRYAHEATRLVADGTNPGLMNVVAQALAHAGDGLAASAMATGGNAAQRRQASTVIAAGLMRLCPEEAARVAEPVTAALAKRLDQFGKGSPLRLVPELAALLLAFPDIREPDPRLRDALHRATLRLVDTPMSSPHTPSMVVLTLLERLGCLPREDTHIIATLTDRWRRSLQPGQEPCTELVLLAAVDGDTAALWHHADAARTPDGRSAALRAAAAHLAGAQVALATDSRADDRVIRTCLALTRACGDGSPPAEATARHIAQKLLRSDAWTYTIPLLPQLAPGALRHLSLFARDAGRRGDGRARHPLVKATPRCRQHRCAPRGVDM